MRSLAPALLALALATGLSACDWPGNGGPYTGSPVGDMAGTPAATSIDCQSSPSGTLTNNRVTVQKIVSESGSLSFEINYRVSACSNCSNSGEVLKILTVTSNTDLEFKSDDSDLKLAVERSVPSGDFTGTLDDLSVDHAFHLNLTCTEH